ncbi:MAG: hypothetical protein K6T55_00890 [Syntrophobacterales bacterium]|mgnify:CR=1 FL=1|nr:hypothetical protein [Syntrophobacterales bacterium]
MPPPEELERVKLELAQVRTQLNLVEQSRRELTFKLEAATKDLQEARQSLARAEALTAELKQRVEVTQGRVRELEAALAKTQEELRLKEAELGSLRTIKEVAEVWKRERDQALQDLAQVKADVERQVSQAVKAALEQVTREHEAASQAWQAERLKLKEEIAHLQDRLAERGVVGHVFPTDLAGRLAGVLEGLAEGRAAPGKQYAAALTSLEVEARGVLEAPRAGETEPRFVTPEAGKVEPGALSTLRMTFRLLPTVRAEED